MLIALAPPASAGTGTDGPLTISASDQVLQQSCFDYQNLSYSVDLANDIGWSLQVDVYKVGASTSAGSDSARGDGPDTGLLSAYLCDSLDGAGTYTVRAVLTSHDSSYNNLPNVVSYTSFVMSAAAIGSSPTGPASNGPLTIGASDQVLQPSCFDYQNLTYSVDIAPGVGWSLRVDVYKDGASGGSDSAYGDGPRAGLMSAFLCNSLDGPGTYTVRAQLTSHDGTYKDLPNVLAWTTFTMRSTDTTAPSASLGAPRAALTIGSTVAVAWAGADAGSGVDTFDVRVRTSRWDRAYSGWSYPSGLQRTSTRSATVPAAAGYSYCFSVRSRDTAGNLSPWTAQRCSARALDDRALAAGAGWSRKTGSGFYAGTVTTATKAGATLSRTGVQASRLGLVATRCTTCGTVGVYLSGRLFTTVNLRAASTQRRALISLPAFSQRTTTVTLKVMSSGKLVQIDGLAVAR